MEWCWRGGGWRGRDEVGGELGGEQQQPGGGDGLEVAGGPFLEALQQPLKIEQQLGTLVQWVSRKRGEKKKVKKNYIFLLTITAVKINSHNQQSQNQIFFLHLLVVLRKRELTGGILLITPNGYFSLASGLARK